MNMTPEEKISKNLKRLFGSFINEISFSNFFTRLNDYVNYILETPVLKIIIEKEIKKRQTEYEKEADLEEKTLKELREAKRKLLKIVKDNKIPPHTLHGEWSTFMPMQGNILDELESFERGKIHTSIPVSNALERYLFEIGVGISRQKYQHLLEEFNNAQQYPQNIYGNFTFSKTLRAREEQTKRIKMAKGFELWGCFVPLLNLHMAFLEASKNSHYTEVFQKYSRQSRNRLERLDAAEITHLTEDLKKLMSGKGQDELLFLDDTEKFRSFATRVNNHLLTELSNKTDTIEAGQATSRTIIIDLQKGIYDNTNKKLIYEISGKRLQLVKYLSENRVASLADFTAITNQRDSLIVKEVTEINGNFKKKLKIKEDLITHSKTGGGYRLNRNAFIIKTST